MKPDNLQPHPEGGRYQEVYRSTTTITNNDGRRRDSLTHIYFSLQPDEVSKFHRVGSDEVWNLYQGPGLTLYLWDGSEKQPEEIELSARANCFCYVVPAGWWQATRPLGDEILVGCSVAPGFEFQDFELIQPNAAEAQRLQQFGEKYRDLI